MLTKDFAQAVFLILLILRSHEALDSRLKSVHLIFRHGERTPDSSHKVVNGGLTETGKKQMYDLGLYIRERYSDFLKPEFDPGEVSITSSDTDRTIRSAGLVTHGLYRDYNLAANWNGQDGTVPYEPIPVRTIPPELDRYLQPKVPCPKLNQLWETTVTPFLDGLLERHGDLLGKYVKETNDNNLGDKDLAVLTRAENLISFLEQIQFDSAHGLPLEDWADEMNRLDDFRYFLVKIFQALNQLPEERKLYGGSFLGLVVNGFSQQNPIKINLYAGHDRLIYAVMRLLDIYDPMSLHGPPTGSVLFFELYQDPEIGQREFVKIFYRNDTMVEPKEMKLGSCSDPCLLNDFLRVTKDLIPINYEMECQVSHVRLLRNEKIPADVSNGSGKRLLYATGAVAIICCAIVITYLKTARNKKHYNPV